ncbi:MAG TPA: glycerol kinase GlpK [Pseudomonadales bacterium]|jgi:glycerol kinase|nr:glycerol kinase [Gammaproteobacteria bacterium]MDP6024946.1 glycerol kinase GlpK [Pseudomonadales bacterium]MDP7316336.1 glycerol kinase GlpK [Pseudomonadales bacterium]HJL61974.1 glycerol kinase GlpK [Pseudomonadales bacterium]HJP52986.1 glycerol kinase GlpK [Pseudomonadales bacterium]|tara:strand:- start:4785 stop:6269 length:1485 start_codon:yes stop_codon:yes gene_type:complete
MTQYIVAIDQGTTSSRAIVFSSDGSIVKTAQQEFTQFFPDDGWVEHDPEEIWQSTVATFKQALAASGIAAMDVAAIGITNQRETTLVWDRKTGEVIYNAIVWQDRRTSDYCGQLKAEGFESTIIEKTGLLLDPYFSGTKLKWILDNVPGARDRANRDELAFGTVDSFLLWRLTDGAAHKTDATNAARTSLFNIHRQEWDDEILAKMDIPASLLPEVLDSSAPFGATTKELFGVEIPITGMAGDQHCALFGQGCFESGMLKSTYGTGCFAILNTGDEPIKSTSQLLTTVAYRLDGKVTYALEGSIFIAGAAVQWLRDGLKLVTHASETEAIAVATQDSNGVYLVPAFTGLGAPHWDADARGAIIGLTRDSGVNEIVTATLQSVCYQTRDLLQAMTDDGIEISVLRVDGGMVTNNWVTQYLADVLKIPVDRPRITETTALGACYLAGLQIGIFSSLDDLQNKWQLDTQFTPELDATIVDERYDDWLTAVQRVRTSV